jgi:hypothetical protein
LLAMSLNSSRLPGEEKVLTRFRIMHNSWILII